MSKIMLMLWPQCRKRSWQTSLMPECSNKAMEGVRPATDQVSVAPAPLRRRSPGQNHFSCSVPLVPLIDINDLTLVASIQSPALPRREAAGSAFPPVAPVFAWHPPGWLETPRAPATLPTGECDGNVWAKSLLVFTSQRTVTLSTWPHPGPDSAETVYLGEFINSDASF